MVQTKEGRRHCYTDLIPNYIIFGSCGRSITTNNGPDNACRVVGIVVQVLWLVTYLNRTAMVKLYFLAQSSN